MFLKYRYRLGFEPLCREVADSITWRRFCRIGLGGSVPHPTTLMKITTRCGQAAVDGLNDALLAKAVEARVLKLSDAYANATVRSRSEYVDEQAAQIDQLVNLVYGLLALAVLIALFSIANSMGLSIYERTRELGLLRAVGMTRRQLRTSVRWESVLVSLLGTGLGALVGIFFGWSISVAIRGSGLSTFIVPVVLLAVIVVLAVLGGVIAATRPASRAARLDVLRAIATE